MSQTKIYLAAAFVAALLSAEEKPTISDADKLLVSRAQTKVYAVNHAEKDARLKLAQAEKDVATITTDKAKVELEYRSLLNEMRKKYKQNDKCELDVQSQEFSCPAAPEKISK